MNDLIINGMKVIFSPYMDIFKERVQFRFPKSKKKRIRNKWKNRSRNYKLSTKGKFIVFDNIIVVDQETYKKLENELTQNRTPDIVIS